MSDETATALLHEMRSLRADLDSLRADLAARHAESAKPAVRVEPYTVKEFAALIRRHREFVSDRCRVGLIRTLPGKPYRIPVGELARWAAGAK